MMQSFYIHLKTSSLVYNKKLWFAKKKTKLITESDYFLYFKTIKYINLNGDSRVYLYASALPQLSKSLSQHSGTLPRRGDKQ